MKSLGLAKTSPKYSCITLVAGAWIVMYCVSKLVTVSVKVLVTAARLMVIGFVTVGPPVVIVSVTVGFVMVMVDISVDIVVEAGMSKLVNNSWIVFRKR